ncbi:DUF222 domain-containing protein, partial [Paenarthrobacter sp. NPDC089316]|uniref:DUF222 domain-containing protein n=1 Tax=Paenarthrobacter sp. NPDC089316 TaxID=3154974 RepID=UPI003415974C
MEMKGQVLTRQAGFSDASARSEPPAGQFRPAGPPATVSLPGHDSQALHNEGSGSGSDSGGAVLGLRQALSEGSVFEAGSVTEVGAVFEVGTVSEVGSFLDDAFEALTGLRDSAAGDARLFGFAEAADFAGRVEEISRCVEYIQIVAAQAVERTRSEAQARQSRPSRPSSAQEWRTGWTEPAAQGAGPTPDTRTAAGEGGSAGAGDGGSVLDDGYRNAAEFLRARLRIGIGEARRRLALAPVLLTSTGTTGQDIPARREELATAVHTGQVSSRSATIISTALDKAQHFTDQDTLAGMEHALTTTAAQSDPDFLTTMARRWTDYIDHDGPEPTEEALRHVQGAFLRRRRRHGLHHLEIFATTEQYEILATAMNVATNPRLTTTPGTSTADTNSTPGPELDRRCRAQKLLDGLVGACTLAMTTGKLPTNGGLRPQLTITIAHHELFQQLTRTSATEPNTTNQPSPRKTPSTSTGAGTSTGTGAGTSTGTATFTGPMHPNTIRKIACDAEILPVLLGTDSQILDIGRSTRIFPPHIR